MDRRNALRACAQGSALLCSAALPRFACAAAPARPARIVFLNPGEPVERGTGPYWRMVAQYMQAAAQQLGLSLEVLWAERDHLLMQRQAAALAARAEAPDYVVLVNEKMAGLEMLQRLAGSKARLLVMHNDITPEQRREIGNERQRIANWIGTVTTDAARGGWLLMKELYRQLGEREASVVGLSGDRSTPVSQEREQGVEQYIREAGRGRTVQVVHGDWSYADGAKKTSVLLSRYADVNLIWASNDSMALGALGVVARRTPRVLVGGMGGWGEALTSIAQGGLAATAAGDYLIGAWAVVLLHDFHHGIDFARHGGVNQKLDYLHVVQRANVARYDQALFKQDKRLDFAQFAKARRAPQRAGPYTFSLESLMRGAAKR